MKTTTRLVLAWTCLLMTCSFATATWNGINYQGRLLTGVSPFSGVTNMNFQIHTQLVGGVATYDETDSSITVVDGLYNTVIGDNPSGPQTLKQAVGSSTSIYLQVTVGPTVLSPRERLNAVPYALDADTLDRRESTEFITISGGTMSNTTTSPILTVLQGGTAATSHAIRGFTKSSAAGAAGVHGMAVGPAPGLVVEGEAGVLGESSSGAGVVGLSLQDVGVYAMSSNGPGVIALSFNDYGLHAASLNTNAIYAEGSIKADKLLYNAPRTNYYIVGPTEFHTRGLEEYDNALGMYLLDGQGSVYAPVHLPHGATVVQFDARVYDGVTITNLVIFLKRYPAFGSGTEAELAQVQSSGSSGWQNLTDTSISNPVVDNVNYFYSAYCFSSYWYSSNKWYTAKIMYTVDEAP